MIDLHCHYLPGIDDGARDIEQSITLARAAVANGITHAVVTPHIHVGRYQNNRSSILPVFQVFRETLIEKQIPLRVAFAAEVRIGNEIPNMILGKEIPFIGRWQGMDVLLLELPHHYVPPETDHFVKWLIKNGVCPLIAHPERNKGFIKDFDRIVSLVRAGCLFQVTAGSITGAFGEPVKLCAEKLLKKDLVNIIATDAHHESRRPPILDSGRIAAEKIVGESSAWDLVLNNPGRIAASLFSNTAKMC